MIAIHASADHSGAVIQGLVGGHMIDIVQLDHVDAVTLTLHDLGL